MEDRIKKHEENPQLWTSISHEIRTPLNVIMGMTDISENEIYDIELMKECFAKIKESTDNMQQVVNALVDYTSIAKGNTEIQKKKLDFKTLITDVAMRAYMLSKEKKCHFNMHVHDVSEEALIGDEARISQVIVALLNVVIRYTASEGLIDFTVAQTGISNSSVFMRFCLRSTALEFPDEIVGYLNDNSLYMDPNLLAPIGTFGLAEMNALYISYLMGGKIQAYNKPGDYSEIIFDIEFGRTEQPYSINGTKLFSNQRILIVADTEVICNERGKMLADMGMEYEIATENDDALEKIGEAESDGNPFTICIADWDMCNQKCIKLIQEIRDIFGRELIILATAHAPENQQKKARQYGANFVIDRTIFRSTLFDVLVSIEKGIQLKQENVKPEKYDFSGSRVLVAEDVPLNMEVITKLLTRVNIEVTCVENGMEAVMQFEKKPAGYFGAVFLDINMPVMDGYEAAKQIRASKREDAAKIPIYAMTANAFKEDVEKALDSGMDGHIAKPIDVNALYRILNQLLKACIHKNNDLAEENAQLREWAEHDPLTGCLNRRGFENKIEELMKDNKAVAYMALDIDDFKQINDRFGHEVGDDVLKNVVRLLRKKFRASDCFVRLGGDEFVVLLVDYKKQDSYLVRRIEEINEELLNPSGELPPVTISVGAAVSSTGYSEDLYACADKALYKSKNSGKGICTIYEDATVSKDVHDDSNQVYTDNIHYMNDQVKVVVENKQQLRSLLMIKNKPVCFASGFCDEGFPMYSFNGFLPEQLGYTFTEFRLAVMEGFKVLVHPDDTDKLLKMEQEGRLTSRHIRLKNKAGDYLWYNVAYILTKTKDKKLFWMASFNNIDDHLVGSLCADDYRMIAVINPDQDAVFIEKGAYMVYSKELHIQKKYIYSTLITQATLETVREDERSFYLDKASLKNVCQKIRVSGVYEFNVYQKWNDSDYSLIRHKYRKISDDDSNILCTWEILGHRAEIDELTDALNENGFYSVAQEIMQKNENGPFSVLYFNVSGFKAWNSTLGKEKADVLLKEIVREIEKSDLKPLAIGRLFSDHFACLVKRELVNFNIVNQLCSFHVEIDENDLSIRMRCGIFNVDNTEESVRNMCDKAKLAKLQITNEHALPYHVYDENLNDKYLQQIHVINHVAHALERKEIKVFYQPIVDAKTTKIVSAEALIRWVLPGNYTLSPAVFIPALEEQGLIADVDSYAQETVINMLKRRNEQKMPIVPVSVNVSRKDFINADFFEKLKNLVVSNEVLMDFLRIEITESAYIEIDQRGDMLLQWLRDRGIKILMDDFGTGFSSLSGLINKQFNITKLDMSLVREIGKESGAEAVVENVISMCHDLNMKVVAEGVETRNHYEFLLDAGCDYIQGYYFYKPVPETEFEKLLDEGK